MSRGDRKSGRAVTPEEAELWNELARTIEKTKAKSRVGAREHEESAKSPPAAARPKPEPRPKPSVRAKPAPSLPPPQPVRKAPPLADFDRRAVRQVASGKVAIDARIDLHGMRQRDARGELRAFLFAAQARGARTVLVITGKGGEPSDHDNLAAAFGKPQRGVLRRAVPQWLEEPELRAVVLSFTAASPRHGGDGALYVQLRKGGNRDRG
jgi:DNA-nicking Smr family endonuclease